MAARSPRKGAGRSPRGGQRRTAVRIRLGRADRPPVEDRLLAGRLAITSSRGVRGPERALIESLDQEIEGRALVVGSREGVAAQAAASLFPRAEVHLFLMDAFEARRARESAAANGLENLRFRLGADLPDPGTFDWVLLPVRESGDAMLAGELILEAHAALKPRGKLLAGTDNGRDRWLHQRILDVFGAATIHRRWRGGSAYIARKQSEKTPRRREFSRLFRARLLGRELELGSRPGVFSHGELDQGTLALSEAASLGPSTRVLDLGCGSGALGIAAALSAPEGRSLLVDSSARAARVARENVERNSAGRNALVLLAPDLAAVREGSFDLALLNPPYYSDHSITERFAREAGRGLAPGGELLLVAKSPGQPAEILRGLFGDVSGETRRGYTILKARKSR